jgi:hypothetical protein
LPGHGIDATGRLVLDEVRASVGADRVRVFSIDVREAVDPERTWIPVSDFSKRTLYGGDGEGDEPSHRAGPGALRRISSRSLKQMLRVLAENVPLQVRHQRVAIITHKPFAELLRRCIEVVAGNDPEGHGLKTIVDANGAPLLAAIESFVQSGQVREFLIGHYYRDSRSSNVFRDVDLLAIIGDPFPDISSAEEDARVLELDGKNVIIGRVQTEIQQSEGRARTIRRSPDRPVHLLYVGKIRPPRWAECACRGRAPGRPASGAGNALGRAVEILQGAIGVVSVQLLELARDHADTLLAGEADLIATTYSPSSNYVRHAHDLALASRVACTLSRRHLTRILRRSLPPEGWMTMRWGLHGRPTRVWEATPGAAAKLLTTLEARGVEVDGQLALRLEVH